MIYLDYQATTPVAPEVAEAMRPWIEEKFANPHSPSRWGREAAAAIEVARKQVEQAIGLEGGSLAFTGSATEAINWALKGTIGKGAGRAATGSSRSRPSMRRCSTRASGLQAQGYDVTVLAGGAGRPARPRRCQGGARRAVALVAVMLVNNEIGVIQPVARDRRRMAHDVGALMLCDAVQGLGRGRIPEGPDLVAVSAHKIHGPKAIGALWMRDGRRARAADPRRRSGAGPSLRHAVAGAVRRLRRCCEAGGGTSLDAIIDHVAGLVERRARVRSGRAGPSTAARQHRYHGNLNIRRDGLDARAADRRPARHRFFARERLRKRIGTAEPCAAGDRPRRSGGALVDPPWLRALHDRGRAGRRMPPDRRRRPRAAGARRVTMVRFHKADGTLDKEVEAKPGQRLLDVAWAASQPLEGACEGVMACSTCHVIVDKADFEKLPRGERRGRRSARPCRPRDADLAAGVPDHPDRGHENARRPHSGGREQLALRLRAAKA